MAVWADARFALRTIRREPAVAALAILSLALGLACAAAAQSLLDAVGFRPLAVPDPDQLVEVRTLEGRDSAGRTSVLDYEDVRSRAHTFSSLAVHGIKGAGISGPDAAPEVVMIDVVSPEYFGTLGVAPRTGRLFAAADSAPDAPPAVVISDKLWRRRFARDPGIVARTIDLDGTVCRVIGVLPSDFTGLTPMIAPDAWILLSKWAALMPGSAAVAEPSSAPSRRRSLRPTAKSRRSPPIFTARILTRTATAARRSSASRRRATRAA